MSEHFKKILTEDLKTIYSESLPWDDLNGKSILITGATGMLASYLTHLFIYLYTEKGINVHVSALCRNAQTARAMFGSHTCLTIIEQDVCDPIRTEQKIDYIFHFAGNASPYFIISDPVGICRSNLIGTFNIAELAKEKQCKKIIFASTREVYGCNENIDLLSESSFGVVDCTEDRACYPESKRAAETILRSYFLQYGIDNNSLRIAHAYGPGMKLQDDGRVMADFIGDAVSGRDIIIKSTGEAIRSFCYLTDAVSAIMTVMFKGKPGAAYNIANETQPAMIRDIAAEIAECHGKIKVTFKHESKSKAYCNYRRTGLDTSAIQALGWQPHITLKEGIRRTLKSFKE